MLDSDFKDVQWQCRNEIFSCYIAPKTNKSNAIGIVRLTTVGMTSNQHHSTHGEEWEIAIELEREGDRIKWGLKT